MSMESNDISQSLKKGPFLGEKDPIIWQWRFKVVLLQEAFYVKGSLCKSQPFYPSALLLCCDDIK